MPSWFSSAVFETAQDIPGDYFKNKKEITSIVQQVSDGDTLKVRHILRKGDEKYDGPMRYHTIVVRLAAIDAPETAKQGQPGQPFAQEAADFVSSKLANKEVKVKLLSRDQYGRAVGLVKYKEGGIFGFFRTEYDISEELLKRGLAVVYRQGGGQYDGSIKRWDALEETAIQQKKGMWHKGKAKVQLPSEYKKAIKAERLLKADKANSL